jgi:hypothetical protein
MSKRSSRNSLRKCVARSRSSALSIHTRASPGSPWARRARAISRWIHSLLSRSSLVRSSASASAARPMSIRSSARLCRWKRCGLTSAVYSSRAVARSRPALASGSREASKKISAHANRSLSVWTDSAVGSGSCWKMRWNSEGSSLERYRPIAEKATNACSTPTFAASTMVRSMAADQRGPPCA